MPFSKKGHRIVSNAGFLSRATLCRSSFYDVLRQDVSLHGSHVWHLNHSSSRSFSTALNSSVSSQLVEDRNVLSLPELREKVLGLLAQPHLIDEAVKLISENFAATHGNQKDLQNIKLTLEDVTKILGDLADRERLPKEFICDQKHIKNLFSKFDTSVSNQISLHHFREFFQNLLCAVRDDYFPPRLRFRREFFVQQRKNVSLEQVYDTLDKLGQGQFGSVYRVREKGSGTIRCCKVVAKAYSNVSVDQARNELNVLRMLDHHNIMKVYECFEDRANIYLICEFVEGFDLQELLLHHVSERGRGLSEDDARRIFRIVVSALVHCHRKRIMHKDLKPANVMMVPSQENKAEIAKIKADFKIEQQNRLEAKIKDGYRLPPPNSKEARSRISAEHAELRAKILSAIHIGDGRPKIVDFGLAELFLPGTYSRTFGGTPYYMAPEVFRGEFNYKCDVWSAGVLLYVILSGYLPFSATSAEEFKRVVEVSNPTFPPNLFGHCSPEVISLIKSLLEKDVTRRPSANELLAHPWLMGDSNGQDVNHSSANHHQLAQNDSNVQHDSTSPKNFVRAYLSNGSSPSHTAASPNMHTFGNGPLSDNKKNTFNDQDRISSPESTASDLQEQEQGKQDSPSFATDSRISSDANRAQKVFSGHENLSESQILKQASNPHPKHFLHLGVHNPSANSASAPSQSGEKNDQTQSDEQQQSQGDYSEPHPPSSTDNIDQPFASLGAHKDSTASVFRSTNLIDSTSGSLREFLLSPNVELPVSLSILDPIHPLVFQGSDSVINLDAFSEPPPLVYPKKEELSIIGDEDDDQEEQTKARNTHKASSSDSSDSNSRLPSKQQQHHSQKVSPSFKNERISSTPSQANLSPNFPQKFKKNTNNNENTTDSNNTDSSTSSSSLESTQPSSSSSTQQQLSPTLPMKKAFKFPLPANATISDGHVDLSQPLTSSVVLEASSSPPNNLLGPLCQLPFLQNPLIAIKQSMKHPPSSPAPSSPSSLLDPSTPDSSLAVDEEGLSAKRRRRGWRLVVYARRDPLVRAVLNCVAMQMDGSAPVVQQAARIFQALDVNNDGELSLQEMMDGLVFLGVPKSLVGEVAAGLDVENSGVVTFTQWLAAVLNENMEGVPGAIYGAFRQMDLGNDGVISLSDLAELTSAEGGGLGGVTPMEALNAMDRDGSKTVDFNEFKRFVERECMGGWVGVGEKSAAEDDSNASKSGDSQKNNENNNKNLQKS
eukprot:GDKJ01012401.1.p1 GENE.GDKJ01012401.1~~GDKJ01012401.1.p1  ORF type:complete len:1228 (-),score=333.08 GDKJ01012401.1:65-3748(-)